MGYVHSERAESQYPSGRHPWAAEALPNGRKALFYTPRCHSGICGALSKSRAYRSSPTWSMKRFVPIWTIFTQLILSLFSKRLIKICGIMREDQFSFPMLFPTTAISLSRKAPQGGAWKSNRRSGGKKCPRGPGLFLPVFPRSHFKATPFFFK